MNGCPHLFAFALPVPPLRPSLPPCQRPPPHSRLILDCSRPPSPHSVPCSYVIPTTTLYPGPPSSPPPSLSLALSLSISPHRTFSSSPFFLGTRRRLPFAVCPCIASSLPRALRTKRARSARCSPLSPGERINDECFTLSPEVGPFSFARARARASGLFCHYPLCFLHILCAPRILFSLFPRFYSSEPVFPPAISLPCVPSDPT